MKFVFFYTQLQKITKFVNRYFNENIKSFITDPSY